MCATTPTGSYVMRSPTSPSLVTVRGAMHVARRARGSSRCARAPRATSLRACVIGLPISLGRDARALVGFGCEQIAERAHERAARSSYGARGPRRLRAAGPRDLLRDLAVVGDRDRARIVSPVAGLRIVERVLLGRTRPRRASTGGRGRGRGAGHDLHRRRGRGAALRRRCSTTQRDPPRFLLPGPAFELAHEARARRSRCERRLEVVERTERVPALGALLQLARRLRAAQQQHAEHRELGHGELRAPRRRRGGA